MRLGDALARIGVRVVELDIQPVAVELWAEAATSPAGQINRVQADGQMIVDEFRRMG
ncbi:MAG: hypothetical protein ACREU9_10285 [Gammaproteobacteria bacterium]